jgi:hypothetical protein
MTVHNGAWLSRASYHRRRSRPELGPVRRPHRSGSPGCGQLRTGMPVHGEGPPLTHRKHGIRAISGDDCPSQPWIPELVRRPSPSRSFLSQRGKGDQISSVRHTEEQSVRLYAETNVASSQHSSKSMCAPLGVGCEKELRNRCRPRTAEESRSRYSP